MTDTVMKTTLVLLPGLDGTGILFEPLLKRLPAGIAPCVLPLPNTKPIGYQDLVPIIASLLPTDKPYFLLGESFSGPLALMLAATRPAGLQGVLLCASFIRNPTYLPSILRHIAGSWMFHWMPQFAKIKTLVAGYSTSELRTLLSRAHSQVSPAVMAQRVRSVLAVNCKDALCACHVPIAYIRGSRDRVVPEKNCREIRQLKPEMQEFVFPAPHLVLQTQPEAAAQAIARFIGNSAGGERPFQG